MAGAAVEAVHFQLLGDLKFLAQLGTCHLPTQREVPTRGHGWGILSYLCPCCFLCQHGQRWKLTMSGEEVGWMTPFWPRGPGKVKAMEVFCSFP